jgi:peptide/nickel transport system ATP-binding protein
VDFPTRRGVLRALDDVSFDIGKGEVLGLVGESGAGKSITGAAIIGLLIPPGRIAGGQIWLGERRIDALPEPELARLRGRHIGMIFQDPLTSLNPLFRIGEQLVETVRTHRRLSANAARRRAIELLDEVGIPAASRRIDDYPHQFSGGMRQRVVIALALAGDPELIIADEPTTALDVSVQAQIITLIKRLATERGTAILLITHDMGVIAQTADRLVVMYAGRVAEIEAVERLMTAPRHPYSQGLMESIPQLHTTQRRLQQISGSMARLANIPAGCAYHPRCPAVFAPCLSLRPPLLGGVACHLHNPA